MIMIRAVGAWVRAGGAVWGWRGWRGWRGGGWASRGVGGVGGGCGGEGEHLCVELEVVDDYVDRYEGGQLEGHVEEQVHHVRLVGEHVAHGRHHGLGGVRCSSVIGRSLTCLGLGVVFGIGFGFGLGLDPRS